MNVKVSVVGVGHLGSRHARIYSEMEGVELIGVVDLDRSRADEVARDYNTRSFPDLASLPPSVEAVSVVVPTDRHFEVATALLLKGYHLLVEKPLTVTVAEATELLKLAEKENLIIQVGHVERFNPAILAVEKIVKEPRFIECHRQAPFQPRGTEVGVVLDLMIHDLEIILHMVASPVDTLEAVGIPILTPHEDIANARIKFKNGCIANVTASRVSPERMRKLRIFQDDAYISLDYIAQEALVFRTEAGRITMERLPTLKSEPLRSELKSFVDSVRLGGKPQVPAEHGLEALKVTAEIIEEMEKSVKRLRKLQEKAREEFAEEIE